MTIQSVFISFFLNMTAKIRIPILKSIFLQLGSSVIPNFVPNQTKLILGRN